MQNVRGRSVCGWRWGARKSDISQQFLIESILVCLVGGTIGITLALTVGYLFNQANSGSIAISFSAFSIGLAFFSSFMIGIIFGYFPAKRAADLAPIEALERS